MPRSNQKSTAQERPPKGSAHVAKMFSRYDVSGLVPGAPVQVPEEVSASHRDVLWVSPDRVLDGPFQHEEYIDPLDSQRLVESIKKDGLYAAFFVNIHPERDGYYFLTAGKHQTRKAAVAAGLEKIPIFIEPPVERIVLAFRALNENTIGVNRSPVNVGFLLNDIKEEFDLTQEDIASRIGRSRGWVNNRMIAAREEPDLQEMVAKAGEDRGLRAMMALRKLTKEERAPIIPGFLAGRYTTDMVEGMAKEIVERRGQGTAPNPQPRTNVVGGPLARGEAERQEEPIIGQVTTLERTADGAPDKALLARNGASPQEGGDRFSPSSHAAIERGDEAPPQASPGKREQRHAREAKLRDAVTRLEAYQRLCDQEQEEEPSQKEEEDLLKARTIIEQRLTRRKAGAPQSTY